MKARSSAARRANTPPGSLTSSTSDDETLPVQNDQPTTDQAKPEVSAAPRGLSLPSLRGFTFVSKPILLWGAIIGVATLALSLGPSIIVGAFGITQKDLNNNAGLVQGWSCLSLLLSLALPFVGGWRATVRQGDWKQGGMTGFWSVIIAEALGLLIALIYDAATGQLNQLSSTDWGLLLQSLGFQVILSFSLGAMGGWYSVWQRRREQQKQEALTTSSS
jgi:hypothetical protein